MAIGIDELERMLQTCLELVQSGDASIDEALARYPQAAEELRPRLEAALWLSASRRLLDPSPGFVPASRQRLVARLQQEQAAQAQPLSHVLAAGFKQIWSLLIPASGPARRRFAFQMALVLVLLATMLTGGAGVAYAAQDAIPGDQLYPLKTSLEGAELFFTPGLAGDIHLHIDFSSRRMIEIQGLVLESRYGFIPETVARYSNHITRAVALLDRLAQRNAARASELAIELHNTLTSHAASLQILTALIPESIKAEINKAVVVAQVGTTSVQEVLVTIGVPLDTATPAGSLAEIPTLTDTAFSSPTATLFGSPTSTASSTTTPTWTPTGTLSITPTATLAGLTLAVPTATPRLNQPDPTDTPQPSDTPVPTDPPEATLRPTKTPKPLPSPTRRPAKDDELGKTRKRLTKP